MTKRRHAHGARAHRPRRGQRSEVTAVCTQVAFVAPERGNTDEQVRDAIHQAMSQAHDALIVGLGNRRRSGVSWVHLRGDEITEFLGLERFRQMSDAITDKIAEFERDTGAIPLDSYAQLLDTIAANPDGVLVVAMCEAVAPEAMYR